MHAADTSELFFDNVAVTEADLLGPLHGGFGVLMNELARERLSLAGGALGACHGVLEQTIAYVNEREVFGKALSSFQNTRFKLAELAAQYRSCLAFYQESMQALSDNTLNAADAAMVKLMATEAQGRIVDECLQLFGGYGYMREYPISRAFVDARVQRIYGGTSEIMKEIIARELL